MTEDIQAKGMCEVNKRMAAHFIRANKEARQDEDINRSILDIEYEDLIEDPIGTVKGIYHYFNVAWSDEFDKCLREFIKKQLKRNRKRHNYLPEQFGQVRQELDAFFDAL